MSTRWRQAGDFHPFDWLGQFVSIRMNWRTGFEKRSQFLIGWKRATNCVVAHSSRLRCFSNAVVGSNGSKESPPRLFSVQNSRVCRDPVMCGDRETPNELSNFRLARHPGAVRLLPLGLCGATTAWLFVIDAAQNALGRADCANPAGQQMAPTNTMLFARGMLKNDFPKQFLSYLGDDGTYRTGAG
jgi:hypothetical protein